MEKFRNYTVIIDGTLIFQEATILALYEKMYRQETHSKEDISKAIEAVESIRPTDFQSFSPKAKEIFQSLCGRLHDMQANEIVDRIFDGTQELRKNGIKNSRDVESLQKAIKNFLHNYRGLSQINYTLLHKASIALFELVSKYKKNETETAGLILSFNQTYDHNFEKEENVALALELLELAGSLYKEKEKKEMSQDLLKKTVFFSQTMQLPYINQKSCSREVLLFIQAAVIKSFEIGGMNGYIPSKREIFEILKEGAVLS